MQVKAYSHAAFLCHQAAEKYLKALWIQRHNEEAPRTHNLTRLARGVEAPNELIRLVSDINPDYMRIRYPDVPGASGPGDWDEEGARKRLSCARAVAEWVVSQLEY